MDDLSLWVTVLLLLGGFAAGFINTVAGGGSAITVPILIELLGSATIANGTNRVAVLLQSLVGIGRFQKGGAVPLWDACRINLRGFPATDYMGTSSTSAQVEVRWNMWKRWGLVAFTGGGMVERSIIETDDRELIRSNGIGLRYLVLRSKRINLRLDYARSKDKDAVYISVGEAF